MLDIGVEVNVISLEMAEALNLLMESLGILYSISFNDSSKRFLRVIRDLDVKVLNTVVTIYIFVAKIVNLKYSIILRNSYLASARTKITYDDEGNYFMKLYN